MRPPIISVFYQKQRKIKHPWTACFSMSQSGQELRLFCRITGQYQLDLELISYQRFQEDSVRSSNDNGLQYLWVCFVLFVCSFAFFTIPHTSEIIWHLLFPAWVISLWITPSRSIYVVGNGRISFCFPVCVHVCIHHTFFIHSSPRQTLRLLTYLGHCK